MSSLQAKTILQNIRNGVPNQDQTDYSEYTQTKYKKIENNFATNIINYLDLNMEDGPWLAGSMARKLFMKEDPGYSDWDIWVKDDIQEMRITNLLDNLQDTRIAYKSDNAITYTHQVNDFDVLFDSPKKPFIEAEPKDIGEHKIQVIKRRHFDSAQDIIDNFDFTVCQVATDGKNFIFGDKTKHDIEHKILRHTPKEPRTDGMIARIIKYTVYGFKPDEDLMWFLEENQDTINWNGGMDDYEAV